MKRKIYIMNIEKIRNREKKNSAYCMVEKCKKSTIRHSHTVQSKVLSRYIAENDHVLYPKVKEEPSDCKIEMKRISVNHSSTFPGFCEEHENLFSYEKNGRIESERDLLLQIFRVICKEYYNKNLEYKHLSKANADLEEKIKEKIKLRFERSINKKMDEFIYNILNKDFKNVKVANGKLIKLIERYKMDSNLFKIFYDRCNEDIKQNKNKKRIVLRQIEVDFLLPVCIIGLSSAYCINKFTKKEEIAIFVINIIPNANKTLICISTLREYENSLVKYFEQRTCNELSILDMIESIMMYGTDSWFIKESFWNGLSKKKKILMLNDIMSVEYNFSEPYRFSIFDDIRKNLICKLEEANKGSLYDEKLYHFIEEAKLKLQVNLSNFELKCIRRIKKEDEQAYINCERQKEHNVKSNHIIYKKELF